jgi:hypothetical protein
MTSRQGGLLELVARGKKDVFFTDNPTVSHYNNVFRTAAPVVTEVYTWNPRNRPEWGKWVDFDLEHRGDLVNKFFLRIQMPTWLPPAAVAANPTGIVTDASGNTFGYCNKVGYQMIHKVQVFQDTILLHELYGEYLDWRLQNSYEAGTLQLTGFNVGAREDTPLAIGRSASLPLLRVAIPVLGWQQLGDPGFPTCVLRKQRFRIRIWLRELQEIVVCSDGRLQPAPWGGKPLRIQAVRNGPIDTTQVTLPLSALKYPEMSLETTQRYVGNETRLFLQAQTVRFPFRHIQFQTFAVEHNAVVLASPPFSSTVNLPYAIDFIGPSERFTVGFRTNAATMAGERTVLSPMVQTMRLNIANIDRIKAWDVAVFREVTAYWKEIRMPIRNGIPLEIYTLSFGGMDGATPSGTVSFTRATKPMLYVTVQPNPVIDPRLPSDRGGMALVYAESWNVLEARDGYGKLMFDDS